MLVHIATLMPKNLSHEVANTGTAELSVAGMTCNNCARHVAEALREIPGVTSTNVSLESGRVTVRLNREAPPKLSELIRAVNEAGYTASLVQSSELHQKGGSWSPLAGWRFNALVGSISTAFLMAGEWALGWHDAGWFRWTAFCLASVVQLLCGAKFYRGAWNQLKTGSSNMDTLVSLGSTTAYLFSVWALLFSPGTHLYFLEAAGIITFVSIGHWIEARVSSRASNTLRNLLNLAPASARRRNVDGSDISVPVSDLKINDHIILRPGDSIPTDAEVISGDSTVNESMLTGEALPATKKMGDKLFAGTLNLDGQVLARVCATGEDTALARIVATVERAQNSRAEIQRLGDRVSNVFVPVVIVCAVLTALWWGLFFPQAQALNHFLFGSIHLHHLPETPLSAAFIYATAVLIVACPCAMGLATPIAIMAGTNAAAARGILIRDGIALEKAGKISAVIFDKTGTLTEGKPTVIEKQILNSKSSLDPIQVAAALGRRSNHPLSRAIGSLSADDLQLTQWQEIRGSGVQGNIEQSGASITIRLGSLPWLAQSGIENKGIQFSEKWMEQGATILGLTWETELIALFALQDNIKRGAAEVIKNLQAKNYSVYLVTGDNHRTARALASAAGIPLENVAAEVRPENKAEFVKKLQSSGRGVAFVGDGINDAPALEQADLGIAVSKASDIAMEAADIILLNSDIHAIPETLALAGATLRTVKQNLFWAFFYNAASIPLAALGLLSPLLCAVAMGGSDLIVIGNALRLRRSKFS
ncbi:MAG: Cu+-exporting ATPase [Verrucomicrobiales bacterium]|nr:Cu+-exporting ATPase [Verrucomicrobiales bacterium]